MYFISKVIVVVTSKPFEDGKFSFAPRSAGTCSNCHSNVMAKSFINAACRRQLFIFFEFQLVKMTGWLSRCIRQWQIPFAQRTLEVPPEHLGRDVQILALGGLGRMGIIEVPVQALPSLVDPGHV